MAAYLWRAVDAEGEVLDVLVQSRRNKRAALKLMRKKYGFVPDNLVTDELRSYAAAAHDLGIAKRHERGRWCNNRAENSHQPTRRDIVTLPNRARNKSPGTSGSRRSGDFTPRLQGRCPEGSVRSCRGEMTLDVESVVD